MVVGIDLVVDTDFEAAENTVEAAAEVDTDFGVAESTVVEAEEEVDTLEVAPRSQAAQQDDHILDN